VREKRSEWRPANADQATAGVPWIRCAITSRYATVIVSGYRSASPFDAANRCGTSLKRCGPQRTDGATDTATRRVLLDVRELISGELGTFERPNQLFVFHSHLLESPYKGKGPRPKSWPFA
jgi:hypothetical protein